MRDLMVAADLQRELIEEITTVLKDIVTTKADGTETTGFTGYEQYLPVIKNDDEDPDQFFPYFLVRIGEGKVDPNDGFPLWYVSVNVYVAIHDEDLHNRGHYSLLTAITRILSRFDSMATLGEPGYMAYRCDSTSTTWALQDDDTYPYFFGAVQLYFWLPMQGRKELNNGWEACQI